MNDIKCVVLDIDGTLLDPARQLTRRTADTLIKAIKKGVTVTIASGRHYNFSYAVLERIGIDTEHLPIISNNGALVSDRHTVFHYMPTPAEAVAEGARIAHETGAVAMLFTPEHILSADEARTRHLFSERWCIPDWESGTVKIYPAIPEMMRENKEPVIKELIVEEDMEKYDALKELLSKIEGADISESEISNLEIVGHNITKGCALPALAKALGIGVENIMAIGDAGNDLELVRDAGFGVAMGNGIDAVKAAAKYVTLDNAHDGAAAAIERFVL